MSHSLILIVMDFRTTHYRAYVYTGFKMGKSVSQLHEELQQVFGQTSAPSLRTVRRWIADIRADTVKPKLTPRKTMFLVAFTTSPARFSVTALPKGVTVTADYMVEFLKATGNRFNNLKSHKIRFKDLLLQMDNARPHSAARTQTYLDRLPTSTEPIQP